MRVTKTPMHVVLITGTREAIGPKTKRAIQDALAGADLLIVGDCPTGVDRYALGVAQTEGINYERHEADWDRWGRSAGPRRNRDMVYRAVDLLARGHHVECAAFPGPKSTGTRDCMTQATGEGIPVHETIAEVVP